MEKGFYCGVGIKVLINGFNGLGLMGFYGFFQIGG